MKFRSQTKSLEPEDAREAFHKSERQHIKQEKINKWLSRLFVVVALAIVVFVLYAYFIDKPDSVNQAFTLKP